MSEESMRWYVAASRSVHFGTVLNNRTGRKGLDIPPLQKKQGKFFGDAFKSNGVDEMVWNGSHYKIPAIHSMKKQEWIREATPEEVTVIEGGMVLDSSLSSEANIPDSDAILKERLKASGLEAPKTDSTEVAKLDEIENTRPTTSPEKEGVKVDWDFESHWMNRKRELEKISDRSQLDVLKKHYAGGDFEKHVDARIKQLAEQIKRGAVIPDNAPGAKIVQSDEGPIKGSLISGVQDIPGIVEAPSEATASFTGQDPGVGPTKKAAPTTGVSPRIESAPVKFDD